MRLPEFSQIKLLALSGLFFCLAFAFKPLAPVQAFSFESNSGLQKTGQKTGHSALSVSNSEPEEIIGLVINAIIVLIGTIFLILIIYAGYTWMTARDNQGKAEEAMKTIKNSILGLLITLSAYAITYFIFKSLKIW